VLRLGATGFIEIGSGKVLRGLLRTIERDARAWSAEDPESLRDVLGVLAPGKLPAGEAV